MSRPLRISYEDAWYHVMNRGACRMNIFNNEKQKELFLEILGDTVKSYKIEVHAYCLMDNHYHLLIKTPLANISKAIQYLTSTYTIRHNRLEGKDGPLFRVRFKSKLVENNHYASHLVRYIHLNPKTASIVLEAEDYQWSSYRAYLGFDQFPKWLCGSLAYGIFGENDFFTKFKSFTNQGNPDFIIKEFSAQKQSPWLGSNSFREKIKKNISFTSLSDEIIEKSLFKPTIEEIKVVVSEIFNIKITDITKSTPGVFNYPRKFTMFIAHKYFRYTLCEIADTFNLTRYQSVSNVIRPLKTEIDICSNLSSLLRMILSKLEQNAIHTRKT